MAVKRIAVFCISACLSLLAVGVLAQDSPNAAPVATGGNSLLTWAACSADSYGAALLEAKYLNGHTGCSDDQLTFQVPAAGTPNNPAGCRTDNEQFPHNVYMVGETVWSQAHQCFGRLTYKPEPYVTMNSSCGLVNGWVLNGFACDI